MHVLKEHKGMLPIPIPKWASARATSGDLRTVFDGRSNACFHPLCFGYALLGRVVDDHTNQQGCTALCCYHHVQDALFMLHLHVLAVLCTTLEFWSMSWSIYPGIHHGLS